MSGAALIVLAVAIAGLVLVLEALTHPGRWAPRRDVYYRTPRPRQDAPAPRAERLDDQVRDRRPPRHHARVRR